MATRRKAEKREAGSNGRLLRHRQRRAATVDAPGEGRPGRRTSPTTSCCRGCSLQAAPRPHPARAHRVASTPSRARGAAGRARGAHRRATSRSPSASCRSPRTSTRSAPTRCASSATRSPRWPRVDEETALAALRPDRRRRTSRCRVIASPDDALATPAPRIHDYGDDGNSTSWCPASSATSDDGVRGADRVLRGPVLLRGQHAPADGAARRARARSTPDGKLTLWSSTQTPHYLHRALAQGAASCRRRTSASSPRPNGGGFGGKSDPFNHEIVVAKLRLMTGRPVKICLTREEVFYCHRGRHPVLMKIRTGVTKDGAITGMHFADAARRRRLRLLRRGVAPSTPARCRPSPTSVPRYRSTARRVFTNKPPCGPKRGHGTPQPRFAVRRCSSTRSPSELGSTRPSCGSGIVAKPNTRHRQLAAASAPIGLARVHRQGGRGVGLEGAAPEAARTAAGSASPARPTSPAPGSRSTGTTCRTRACSCKRRPQRRRHRLLRRDRDRPGLGRRARLRRRRGARHRAVRHPVRHRRHRPHAGRPRLATPGASR